MIRTAARIKALQKGTSSSGPRVVPVQWTYCHGGLGASSCDGSNETAPARPTFRMNAEQLLRSVYQTRDHRHFYSTGAFQWNSGSLWNSGGTRRSFATSDGTGNELDPSPSSVDSTLERLFRENQVAQGDVTPESWADAANAAAQSYASSGMDFVPTWYYPGDWCIRAILKLQELGDLDVSTSIILTTLIARILLFPVVASGQKAASRMAHLAPELKYMQKKYEHVRNPTVEDKARMGEEVQALFKKYETNPIKSLTAPVVQLPFMLGMFFGLKKMPDYFPEELASGGMFWFPDLSVPDPTYILPGICFVTFLGTVELGKEQMMASSPDSAPTMILFMRGLSVVMFGVCANFPGALVLYFTVTNIFTVIQIGILKLEVVKDFFGIWDPPKPVPGQAEKSVSLFEETKKLMDRAQGKIVDEKVKIKRHNEAIEAQNRVMAISKNRNARRRAIKKRDD